MEFLQWIIQGLAFQMVFMAIFQALISLSMMSLSITPTSKFYLVNDVAEHCSNIKVLLIFLEL